MKKEYMKKRVENWCILHDCVLYISSTGVYVLVDKKLPSDNFCHELLFPSLTKLYNYLFTE